MESFLNPSSSSPTGSWPLDEFALDPGYLAYQEELRCLIFDTAQTAAPTREGSPASLLSPGVAHFDTPSVEQQQIDQTHVKQTLSVGRRLEYYRNYVAEVAPWLDMFDSQGAFTIQVPDLAHRSPALLYAILALSARQMERKEGRQHSFDSLELYQEAIRLLGPSLQARDLTIIPICVILCCLEMMSASRRDWRRHLEGCAALFNAFGVNGFSGGLLQAVFWCYARMDLCGALISEGTQRTMVPLEEWLPPNAQLENANEVFLAHISPDMHANYAVFLCAKTCELIADQTGYVELGEQNGCDATTYGQRWQVLWEELQEWVLHRPRDIIPVHNVESRPFPQIMFVHSAGISSNQLYHAACVLLLEGKPRGVQIGTDREASAIWHAKRICGISFTNPHRGCLNNAIQPLWIAGKLLTHKDEHILIVKLIRSIEAMTGWATSWRIADLETNWGHSVSRNMLASKEGG
ncbi:C6 zinc finger domain-containing [Paramyrothecium foliicola]|nr:C6 zinc finger domain-containing [Paramyrothecium foliicola]